MAHVEKRVRRGNTTWRARYRSPDGSERSKTFARRTDAEKFLARVQVDKSRGNWIDPDLSKVRFDEWAERWMGTTNHLKPKTIVGYQSLLRSRILPTFGRAPLGSIRPIDIREWLSDMQAEGLSASRCRAAYHLVGSIFRAAVEDGRIATSPCIGIKLPRLPQLDMSYLEPSQLKELLVTIDPHYRVFVQVLASGGLRFGEAAALRVGRCDLRRSRIAIAESLADVSGTLHFGPPKTHQRRMVHLPRTVCDGLAEHLRLLDGDDSTLVFQSPRGGTIRYANFARRIWKPALQHAGVPNMGLHALRHTCAAMLIAQGAHPKAIQSHLGHQSITTTLDRYGHLFEDVHERLAERVDEAYADIFDASAEDSSSDIGANALHVVSGTRQPQQWSR
jgi:integrase